MKEYLPYYKWVFAFFFICIALEYFYTKSQNKKVHDPKDSLANLIIIIGYLVAGGIVASWQIFILGIAYSFTPIRLPENIFTFIGFFIFVDLLYYFFHRIMHETKLLWAFHVVHHSSQNYNLLTSFRLNWFGPMIAPFFFLPAAFLGISPKLILLSFSLNLVYQFWLHTETIGKLGFLENIINTPSSHRVHHGSNELYLDKNYSGVFIIWDRIFGTYQPEEEKVKYGTTKGFVSYNPFVIILHGFYDLIKGKMNYKG